MMDTRSLQEHEITALQDQGCFSSDWSKIEVKDPFSTEHIHRVRFEGELILGTKSCLYNCRIRDCEIGDDVLIENVNLISNYRIGEKAMITNAGSISVVGPTSFGNGVELEVLNEGGGRELKIIDTLSAQLAYMMVSYRHDQEFIGAVNRMVEAYTKERTGHSGVIGTGTTISNAGTILNVQIGPATTIRGTALLQEGTLSGNSVAPVFIGENVIARQFIIQSGSRVDGGAMLDKCLIGQGVGIGKQFSAENSVFFSNSEAFHGEAVSVFGGPYTVTHHKSSLLIAGMFSFYNAGSGTNQSNHMYKLGPLHQGIMERGSKTGSFAYLLWPCRIGAFSVVMGKNQASFDTGDFPFSYINVDHEKSILTPGMNLFTVGTRRDSEKWPKRDKRKDPVKLDLINFDFLSPYIIQKVIRALDALQALYEKASQKQETVFYKGIRIKRLMLKSTRKYYEMALTIFVGNQLIKRLETKDGYGSIEAIREKLAARGKKNMGDWIDMAGMIAPGEVVSNLISEIRSGKVKELDEVYSGLITINDAYGEYTWEWTVDMIKERFRVDTGTVTVEQLLELITRWETESIKLDKMILNDAAKEFDDSSRIGFGIDGDRETIDEDFKAVRGLPDDNSFIRGIREEMKDIETRAAAIREALEKL